MFNSDRLILSVFLTLFFTQFSAADGGYHKERYHTKNVCSSTARVMFNACQFEVLDDFFVRKAGCMNTSDNETRDACYAEMREEKEESKSLCI